MISIEQLDCTLGDRKVLDNLSLTIPKGKFTSIIGPNGAGKSTLLSLISRLIAPEKGRILVDGLDVQTTQSHLLARRIAILRQDNQLNCRLTVRDLVAFGRYPHSRGHLNAADETHIENALTHLNLHDMANRFIDELSGGQRQRAYIAMALCQDTDYVLLDEPLNNLDIKHAVGMMKLLRQTADAAGKTFVLVLHDLNFASCYSDHIIALREGKTVFQGDSSALMQPETIATIYDMDMEIHALNGRKIGAYYI